MIITVLLLQPFCFFIFLSTFLLLLYTTACKLFIVLSIYRYHLISIRTSCYLLLLLKLQLRTILLYNILLYLYIADQTKKSNTVPVHIKERYDLLCTSNSVVHNNILFFKLSYMYKMLSSKKNDIYTSDFQLLICSLQIRSLLLLFRVPWSLTIHAAWHAYISKQPVAIGVYTYLNELLYLSFFFIA